MEFVLLYSSWNKITTKITNTNLSTAGQLYMKCVEPMIDMKCIKI